MNLETANIIRKHQGLEPIEVGGDYPNFNEWVDALEADPDYIKKREAELDEELGKDRLF